MRIHILLNTLAVAHVLFGVCRAQIAFGLVVDKRGPFSTGAIAKLLVDGLGAADCVSACFVEVPFYSRVEVEELVSLGSVFHGFENYFPVQRQSHRASAHRRVYI